MGFLGGFFGVFLGGFFNTNPVLWCPHDAGLPSGIMIMLRILDVYPGSECQNRIPVLNLHQRILSILTQKIVYKLQNIHPGSGS